jgi:hypothetical protein
MCVWRNLFHLLEGVRRQTLNTNPYLSKSLSHEHRSETLFNIKYISPCGPGSVVGIATGYGLNGPRIESRWRARFSAPVQTGPGAHPASCTMGTGSFAGVKSDRGVTLTPSSPSSTVGHERVELYLYSPYGPYGLYRASVPVQGRTLPSTFYINPYLDTTRF